MPPLTDTAPHIEALLVAAWRTQPVHEKLAQIGELNALLQRLAVADIRRLYPDASPALVRRHLAVRWLGADLAERVLAAEDPACSPPQ